MKSLSVEPPHAIVTVGIPGSGKTFFASKFAETFKAPFVHQEHIEQFAKDSLATQEIINTTIEQLVKTKQSIVIDVDTSTRTARMSLMKYLRSVGYEPLFVWIQIDADTGASRCMKRRKISLSEYERLANQFTHPKVNENALVLSGKHTYPSQARIVLKKLSSGRESRQTGRMVPQRGKILIR